jgi:hypothetical protein
MGEVDEGMIRLAMLVSGRPSYARLLDPIPLPKRVSTIQVAGGTGADPESSAA